MAPPAASPPASLPPGVAEFLLLLSRVETLVGTVTGLDSLGGGVEHGDDDEKEECIWRAKVVAYERTLNARLAACERNLGRPALIERYRSRIEELGPALELALERRRAATVAAAAPPPPPAVEVEDKIGSDGPILAEDVVHDLPSMAESDKSLVRVSATSVAAPAPTVSVPRERPALQEPAWRTGQDVTEIPWRRKAGASSTQRVTDTQALKGDLEKEMVDLTDGMKGAANSFLKTLKRDNDRLDDMSAFTEKQLDNVTSQAKKGKQMLWSGQLGFVCVMIMLAVSVVIFFMMIPFIIFT